MKLAKFDEVTKKYSPVEIKVSEHDFITGVFAVPAKYTSLHQEVSNAGVQTSWVAGKTILSIDYKVTYLSSLGLNAGYVVPHLRKGLDILGPGTGEVWYEGAFCYGEGVQATCKAIITYLE